MNNIMTENIFREGEFSFDFDSGIFSVSGKTIGLDRDERRILRILTDNVNITVGNDVLICRIWEDTDFVNEAILEEKVNRLSEKLSAEKHIISDGTGYKWKG